MNVTVDLLLACNSNGIPDQGEFNNWVLTALHSAQANDTDIELGIRIVDKEESAYLNEHFRNKPGATNVLSFPFSGINPLPVQPLGDLAICAPVVEEEALQQHKDSRAHWAHMTVHGTLHLLGMDHETSEQAEAMENIEIAILDKLGFSNPYDTCQADSQEQN